MALLRASAPLELVGRRVHAAAAGSDRLRPVDRGARPLPVDWLKRWEPSLPPGHADASRRPPGLRRPLRRAGARAPARHRLRLRDLRRRRRTSAFAGEINISSIQRGPFQNAYVGYWIDEALRRPRAHARGDGARPAVRLRGARPAPRAGRDHPPQRHRAGGSCEKLGLREEGVAERYLEINGVWEDHVRYAITAEEWAERGSELLETWVR